MRLQPDEILELLKPVLATPARSKARGIAVKAAASKRGVTERVIRKWLDKVERSGLAGLLRTRSDQGRPRIIVSKAYDEAIGTVSGPEMLDAINGELIAQIKKAYNSQIGNSRRQVQLAATTWLFHRTKHLSLNLTDRELRRICHIPFPKVRRHRRYHVPYIMKNNAPTWMSNYQPRGLRSREGMWFGAMVCIDCSALDIVLHRNDGSECFAKVIGFQDLATNTLFFHIVWPEKGKGITQADVAAAFIMWCRRWGVPASVLVDNGSEFRKLDVLSDMMKLSAQIGHDRFKVLSPDTAPHMAKIVQDGLLSAKSAIKRARAHNPQTKPIEGQFGNVTRFIFSVIEGWVGGDRLIQPTRRQGHRAQHFTGTPEQLQQQINEAIAYYDNLTQSGHLSGKCPAEARAKQAAAGVERVDVNIGELIEYWSSVHTCAVRQGRIIIPKLGPYWGAFLHTLKLPAKVTARVPLVGDTARIAIFDEYNTLLGFAEPLDRRHILTPQGAVSQRDRAAAARSAVRELDRESAGFNPLESRRQFVAMHPVPTEFKSAGVIQIDEIAKSTALARHALPALSDEPARDTSDVWLHFETSREAKAVADGDDRPVDPQAAPEARSPANRRGVRR